MHPGVIRVEDLLRSPALQLRLIAGADGTSRRVAWAHVSELEDPTPWLAGAEMIMTTGMALRRGAERQRAYLQRLDDAGVSCLAVSEAMFAPPLTRAFRAEAERRRFPVVEVPLPVPFMAISQEVAAAVQGDTGQRLNAQLQVFGAVQWLADGSVHPREIFARLERLSGYALYACTVRGGELIDGLPVPPAELAGLVPRSVSRPSPPTVPGGYALPVSGPRGTAGYVLAIEKPEAAPAGVSVVQHIATVAALQLAMRAHEREVLRREGAETLAEMLQGVLEPAVVARRLAARGFPAGQALVLAVARARSGPGDASETGRGGDGGSAARRGGDGGSAARRGGDGGSAARRGADGGSAARRGAEGGPAARRGGDGGSDARRGAEGGQGGLHSPDACQDAADALAASGIPHLVLRQQDELYALVPEGAPVADTFAAAGVVAGLSRPLQPGAHLGAARREAHWAAGRAADAGRVVASYGEGRTERWLTTERTDLRGLVAEVLGPALSYDSRHATDLVPTVRVWLEHDRRTERAARALHVHPNTLLYRLRRFEEVSGRSLASTDSLAELWLALRADSPAA
jgi:purine catabolism regulator